MPPVVAVILILAIAAYFLANRRALAVADGRPAALHSRPGYYASYAALMAAGPAIALWAAWRLLEPVILRRIVLGAAPAEVTGQSPESIGFFMTAVRRLAEGLPPVGEVTPAIQAAGEYYGTLLTFSRIALLVACAALALVCVNMALRNVQQEFRARNVVERWCTLALWLAAGISVATTAGIVFSVLFESIRFFGKVPLGEFLFGLQWSPQTALRADQVGSSGAFGAVPLFAGTLLITFIAMLVAGPIGMFSAIYLSQYASPVFRGWAKPVLEILAGIPTVVYGFFAALTVAPAIRGIGEWVGLDVPSESALAAGLVMGVMIIPFVSSWASTRSVAASAPATAVL